LQQLDGFIEETASIWRLAAVSLRGFRRTLDEHGFTKIQTPKLVADSTESGADVFVVDYFGRPAYWAPAASVL
jgi:nondiscriminating aspartyl-tRNA synthetase